MPKLLGIIIKTKLQPKHLKNNLNNNNMANKWIFIIKESLILFILIVRLLKKDMSKYSFNFI
jgi:hypothetical protein